MKTFIGITGIFIFVSSILLGIRLHVAGLRASSFDNEKKGFGIVADGPLPCSWDVKMPERVMTENNSQAIVIPISNSIDEKCESVISLRAPGFDLSPNKEEQKIGLPASGSGSLSWIVSPRKSGTFELAISDMISTKVFGVTVTNAFGLNATQAKMFSIAGTLFGPMFTVPWWWEKFFLRKKKQEPNSQGNQTKEV